MTDEASHLTITVDKSHILSLGERLYEQSIELIRELVNNAYDADATRVEVTVSGKEIVVSDNGEGMDLGGLEQYFNVGSDEKLLHPISLRFKRDRIGQFGIGKFASLAAASRFEITTQKEDFAARVVFDRTRWLEQGELIELTITLLGHSADAPRAGSRERQRHDRSPGGSQEGIQARGRCPTDCRRGADSGQKIRCLGQPVSRDATEMVGKPRPRHGRHEKWYHSR